LAWESLFGSKAKKKRRGKILVNRCSMCKADLESPDICSYIFIFQEHFGSQPLISLVIHPPLGHLLAWESFSIGKLKKKNVLLVLHVIFKSIWCKRIINF